MEKGRGLGLFWLLMGRMALLMGVALLIPFVASVWWQEPESWLFLLPAGFSLLLGAGLCRLFKAPLRQLTLREGALFIVFSWVLMGIIGAMPYRSSGLLSGQAAVFFETFSSLTTTGLSCLNFDRTGLPQSLLLWHSMMSWLGGLSFIIMLVTVLPQVSGCFGLTLTARQSLSFRPFWHRMSRAMWYGIGVYTGLSAVAMLLFCLVGLPPFEALIRAMTTLSSGGGTSFYSFMLYDDPLLELVAGLVMLLSSLSLLLCWKAWARKSFRLLWQDAELRCFCLIFLGAGLLLSGYLYHSGWYDLTGSLRYGFFQAASFLSTNGFASAPFWLWPGFDRYVLFLLVFVGGCMGSAAGGLKVMRILVLFRMTWAELRHTLHPHMVVSVRIDGLPVASKILGRILTYFFLYLLLFIVASLILSLAGITLMQAMGIAAGCLTSTGSTATLFGLGSLYFLPDWAKWACCVLMVLGRIEIFSFLILVDMGAHVLQRRW